MGTKRRRSESNDVLGATQAFPSILPLLTDGDAQPSTGDDKAVVDAEVSKQKGRTLVRRQRARHACLGCRARKVRCDVMITGTPCTNCKLDDDECTIQRRKRRRDWSVARDTTAYSAGRDAPQPDGLRRDEVCETEVDLAKMLHVPADWDMNDSNGFTDNVDLERLFTTLQDDELSVKGSSLEEPSSKYTEGLFPTPELIDYSPLSALDINPVTAETSETRNASASAQSDRFIKGAKNKLVLFVFYNFIGVDVLNICSSSRASSMEEEGCFHLPPKAAMDEFMRQYFLYVHPFMPLIDEGDFWSLYLAQDSTSAKTRGDCSLFVVQAMLFMSCPFVSEATLSSLGLHSVREARAVFYFRAKALFDYSCCQDYISRAQGALMLTYHSNHPGELISTYWLDTAIHFARKAGADRTRDAAPFTSRIGQIRKRLWWCCILRDSIMSLGLRRRLSITPSEEVDYVQCALTEDDFNHEIWKSHVCKPDEKQVLVRLFVTLCKLGIILKDALELLYTPGDDSPLGKKPRTREDCEIAKSLMAELDLWCDATRAKVQVHASSYEDHQDSIKLLSNAIYIYYHSARTSLLNHMILISVENCGFRADEKHVTQHWVQTELNKSFRCVTRSLTELEQRGLAQYLPNTFIALSAFSFVWYTLGAEVTRPVAESSTEIMAGLRTIVCQMTIFRNLYENTDHFLQCIGKLVSFARSAGIVDTLFPGPASGRLTSKPRSGHVDPLARRPSGSHVLGDQCCLEDIAETHRHYLWLTLSIDYSLCHGDLPNVVNFPHCLQRNAKAILAE